MNRQTDKKELEMIDALWKKYDAIFWATIAENNEDDDARDGWVSMKVEQELNQYELS